MEIAFPCTADHLSWAFERDREYFAISFFQLNAFNASSSHENRLVGVTGAITATFKYDGDGNRVQGTVGGVTTTYIGNYYEWTGEITTTVKYYYAGATRIAMRVGNGTQTERLYWLLSDHLGSTAITTDSAGNKSGEVRYKAWGETRFTSGSIPTTFRFTGQRQEEQLGLYFYNARWYDPALGRFIQADTIVPGMGNSQAWDRYAYTLNNPLRYVDPSGHDADCSPWDSACRKQVDLEYFGELFGKIIKEKPSWENFSKRELTLLNKIGLNKDFYSKYFLPIVDNETQDFSCIGMRGGCPFNRSDPFASIYGINLAESNNFGTGYYNGGVEFLLLPDWKIIVLYIYGGNGNAVGVSGSATFYGGVVFNANTPEDYFGLSDGVGITLSAFEKGISASYFWSGMEGPFTPGNVKGLSIGYSPGAHASIWFTVNNYVEILRIY